MATPPEATRRAIARAAELLAANRPSRPRLVDLGSGDGRLVIAAARLGFDAVGVELNPVLLLSSYIYAARAGVLGRVSFLACDLWGLDQTGQAGERCWRIPGGRGQLDQGTTAGATDAREEALHDKDEHPTDRARKEVCHGCNEDPELLSRLPSSEALE